MLFTKQNTYREDVVMLMGDGLPLPIITVLNPDEEKEMLIISLVPMDFLSREEVAEVVKSHFPNREVGFYHDYDAHSKQISDMMPDINNPLSLFNLNGPQERTPAVTPTDFVSPTVLSKDMWKLDVARPHRKSNTPFADLKKWINRIKERSMMIQASIISKPKSSRNGKPLKPWER